MNILDENFPEPQCKILRGKRIPHRKIGPHIGRKGLSDQEIIALLHGLHRPTLWTLDEDYYHRRLCHAGYSLIHLAIPRDKAAEYVRLVLKHRQLNTRAKRMGFVLSASPGGLAGWQVNQQVSVKMTW